MSVLQELLKLPIASVYGLRNDLNKKIYLTYSTETIISISRNTKSIRDGSHMVRELISDIDKLELVILERLSDDCSISNLKVRYESWVAHYRNIGYTLYREYKSVSYRVKVCAIALGVVGVYIINKRNTKTLVGRFASMDEANEWTQSVYKDNIVNEIVYHVSIDNNKKRT